MAYRAQSGFSNLRQRPRASQAAKGGPREAGPTPGAAHHKQARLSSLFKHPAEARRQNYMR